jgi:hypothetical protein
MYLLLEKNQITSIFFLFKFHIISVHYLYVSNFFFQIIILFESQFNFEINTIYFHLFTTC